MRATRSGRQEDDESSSPQAPREEDVATTTTTTSVQPRRKRYFQVISEHASKDAALAAMLQRDGCVYRHLHNQGKRSPTSIYKCASHKDCDRRIRLVFKQTDDGASVVSLEEDDFKHNDDGGSPSPGKKLRVRGVSPLLKEEVDAMLRGGAGPKKCRKLLVKKYQNDATMMRHLPDEGMLKNRKASLKKAPHGGVHGDGHSEEQQSHTSNNDRSVDPAQLIQDNQHDVARAGTNPGTSERAAEATSPPRNDAVETSSTVANLAPGRAASAQSTSFAPAARVIPTCQASPSPDIRGFSVPTTDVFPAPMATHSFLVARPPANDGVEELLERAWKKQKLELDIMMQRFASDQHQQQREEREQERARSKEQQELQRQTIELQKRALDMQEKAMGMQDRLMSLMERVMDKLD